MKRLLGLIAAAAAMIAPTMAFAIPLPAGVKAVPAADITTTFSGKTYRAVPGGGSGYFAKDGAYSEYRQQGSVSAAGGKWTAADGRLCYHVTDQSIANLALKEPGTTFDQCFDYQQAAGTIYQRNAGDGSMPVDPTATDWVVFKSAKADSKDLVNSVSAGDTGGMKRQQFTTLAVTPAAANPKYGQQVKGDAIMALLWGHAATNTNNTPMVVTVQADGTTAISNNGVVAPTGSGKSRVVKDMYCIQTPLTQPERCFLIYKMGDNSYDYLFVDGTLNFPFSLKPV